MNRRHFLASAAAIAIAPSCPAQPATFWANAVTNGGAAIGDGVALYSMPHPYMISMGCGGSSQLIHWSDQQDHNDWRPA